VQYRWPDRPVVVVCIDGGDLAYLHRESYRTSLALWRLGSARSREAASISRQERADQCNTRENGIENVLELVGMPLPDMYSPELSLFVQAGIRLLEMVKPLIMYLSLTDYVQHKYAPGEPDADQYYRNMDDCFGRLDELGAVVGLVADHGMRDKSNPDGSPKVVWLQDALDLEFGNDEQRSSAPSPTIS
jgi:phosphonoacetate hydrolase